jgi:hypothetical protein
MPICAAISSVRSARTLIYRINILIQGNLCAAATDELQAAAERRSSPDGRRRRMAATDHLGGRADERSLLSGFLDWYRSVIERKVHDLSRDDAARVMTPTGLSLLGVVAHLAAAEVGWFAETFAGEPADPMWEDYGSFRLRESDTVETVVVEYRNACARSRTIADAASSLDQLSVIADEYRGNVSLRWILVHMIEETARHAGHLDLMREQIDGQTGD